jgi:hypothetical protein
MLVRSISLMLALAGSVVLSAQPKERDPSVFDSFPVPPASKNLLFYIQRNKNANTIVYEARFDAQGQLAMKNPVDVNWIRHTEGGKREPISLLETNLAYGVKHRSTDAGVAKMAFVASARHPFRVEVGANGQAEARMMINGRYARLHHVEIHADESALWPKIQYVDIHGIDLLTGLSIEERYIP